MNWLIDWLLIDWCIDSLTCSLIDWLLDWLSDWLIDLLIYWLIDHRVHRWSSLKLSKLIFLSWKVTSVIWATIYHHCSLSLSIYIFIHIYIYIYKSFCFWFCRFRTSYHKKWGSKICQTRPPIIRYGWKIKDQYFPDIIFLISRRTENAFQPEHLFSASC